MPFAQGPRPSIDFASTNGTLRKEIKDELLDRLSAVSDLMRTADSIAISPNFHLDSRWMTSGTHPNHYKVDIQYRKGQGLTVGEIMLSPAATSLDDAKSGLNLSVAQAVIYIVT